MGRTARFTIKDGIYHIMLRGINHRKIFHAVEDYSKFYNLLIKYKNEFSLKVFHYVFMSNHIHLIVKADNGESLSQFIKRVNVSYVSYYRKKYGGIGHFFQERYKSFVIQDDRYMLACGKYIELNPVAAGLTKNPGEYEWSSYNYYIKGIKDKLLDASPEYERLSNRTQSRMKMYEAFVNDGVIERRKEERFFKDGFYGSKKFEDDLISSGLKSKWSHPGKPRKKKCRDLGTVPIY